MSASQTSLDELSEVNDFDTNEREGVRNRVMRIIDGIIISELEDDPQIDVRNWILMPKKKVNIIVYKEIVGVFGEIMAKNHLTTLFLYFLVFAYTSNHLSNQNIMNITYIVSFIYSVNVHKKEKYLIRDKLNRSACSGEFSTEASSENLPAVTSIYDLLGMISKFSHMIDSVVFGLILCRVLHSLTFLSLLLLVFVRSSTFIFQIRLFIAINNGGKINTKNEEITILEDDFMLNKIFETFLSKGLVSYISTLYRVNGNTDREKELATYDNHTNSNILYAKPLKVMQASDFVFTLSLFSLERVFFKHYVLNKHKEAHEFNISIYFIWKTLSQEVPLNVAKLFIILFSNDSGKANLIFSLVLSIINTLAVFSYLFINKKVISDVFG
ncbi:hypothetical protein FG386_000577 [Cryptosporidium ryanae]|uniref:uncharacterized protein n=1 Tax=Cryptosporidium ryanae TaxID=515981 RepID=UPI00351A58BC|nr:hypothetical protein FG386_000577 [Cryptosporidium ryanae]